MPASQQHVSPGTPMGANLIDNGAVFRAWAPAAKAVYVSGSFNGWAHGEPQLLVRDSSGYWAGFFPGVADGDQYKFWIEGDGSKGFKRDPYARELTRPDLFPGSSAYPFCNCVVRSSDLYPWHDAGFRTPAFNDFVIYQFHIGVFFGPNRETRTAKLLDVLDKIEYLAKLGVNALEPLPVVEYASPRSMGYEGSDLFSPEMDYQIGVAELDTYTAKVNALLAKKGQAAVTKEVVAIPVNQLKLLVDIAHLYGMAVIFDVVYNHVGGQVKGQDESIYFFDREAGADGNQSQFFLPIDYSGGPAIAIWKQPVQQFLIDNVSFFAKEYHADGFRYDQVSALVQTSNSSAWGFCQSMTGTVRTQTASCLQVAEYWNVDPYVVKPSSQGGAGFDATWNDGLRNNIYGTLRQVAGGQSASVTLDGIMGTLRAGGFDAAWKAVQHIENQDTTYAKHPDEAGRIVAMADPSDHRSWRARSRSRVATGLVLTAPGIPLLFMGQEFLEDKRWSDNPGDDHNTLLWWDGFDGADRAMGDHYQFTSELCWLRRRHPGLRGEGFSPIRVHNVDRVIAFQRWVEGAGRDVVVVASFNESTYFGYRIGFPLPGHWMEVFNSDVYDNWVNPWRVGNGGGVDANGEPWDGKDFSAEIVIPANGLLVFARDNGD